MSKKPVKKEEGKTLTPGEKSALGMEERDYSAEQNSRVLPFVRTFLGKIGSFKFGFATDDSPEAAAAERKSYDQFYEEEFIPEAMNRDIRLTDLQYAFQMTKTTVSMLQSRATQPGNTEDPLRMVPVAQEIFNELSKQKTLMLNAELDKQGNETEDVGIRRAKHYDRILKEVVDPIFEKYNVTYLEVPQVFAIMGSLVDQIEGRTGVTLDGAREIADCKLWGVDDTDDITIKMVHEKCVEK